MNSTVEFRLICVPSTDDTADCTGAVLYNHNRALEVVRSFSLARGRGLPIAACVVTVTGAPFDFAEFGVEMALSGFLEILVNRGDDLKSTLFDVFLLKVALNIPPNRI